MVSDRMKHAGIGAAITFVIGLGPAIPALGMFVGFLFTFGGGLVGGAVAAGLHRRGGTEGVKVALIATLIGGVASSVVASIVGTLLNVVLVADASTEPGGYVLLSIIGFVTGIPLTLVGGALGGAVLGFLTAPDDV